MSYTNLYSNELHLAAENSENQLYINSEDFYFQKALDKYEEFKEFSIDENILDQMILKTKTAPFIFEAYYHSFEQNPVEFQLINICGKLISYIDLNAPMKKALNEYKDSRTIMSSGGLISTVWIQSILNYKKHMDINKISSVIVRNAIRYIENPDKVIATFSDDKKLQFNKTIFGDENADVFACMKELGIEAKNPLNNGILYSRILWSDQVKPLWDKIFIESSIKMNRAWIYAPGEKGNMWDTFYEQGIMAINWDEMGDLSLLSSKNEVGAKLSEVYPSDSDKTHDKLALWEFSHIIEVGDIIYAKAGRSILLGVGEVESDYIYDESRANYTHIRKVKWLAKGQWHMDDKFALKTLTDITKHKDFCDLLHKTIFGSDFESYTKEDFLSEVFISDNDYDTITELLKRKKNIIFQGAPGVGKTFAAKRLAYSIMGLKDNSRVEMVQFHQSYSYEDFIMGYRPNGTGFELKFGPFYTFCENAREDSSNDYFFIIDEINRGNLSKIFGELLMLIESDKRGQELTLTYSEQPFSVPENVHIIGMMNTADRSLAMIDYALRRRFCFFELEPAFESDKFKNHLIANELEGILVNKIITKFNSLNYDILNDANLGKGFRIGHSYFCNTQNVAEDWYKNIIKYEIAPLLEEYWFDDENIAQNHIDALLGE